MERGWVIEHESSEVSAPEYFTVLDGEMGWSDDSGEAIRFARQEDAKRMESMMEGDHRIAEHTWG